MSHAILIVAGLAVAADPPAVPVLKPPELPPALRERVRELIPPSLPTLSWQTTVSASQVIDRAARPLHAQELAEQERWLALRPSVERRQRAAQLAEAMDDRPVLARHSAALRHAALAAAVAAPRSASRREELAERLSLDGRQDEATAVARQAVRLDPRSVAARLRLARALGAGGDWPAALNEFEAASDIDPADWRVPATRADIRLALAGQRRPVDPSPAAALSAVELDRQSALRLGGADAACLRWSAATAQALALVYWPQLDAASAARRGMDVALPALALAVDHPPADSRVVALALTTELIGLRARAGDLLPAGPGRSVAYDRFPADARLRIGRWLNRVADAVAADDGPEAAEKAVAAARLFCMMRQFDRAVAAADRATHLRPDTPYCEEAAQVVLLYADRAADALARCRAGGAGRTAGGDCWFEVRCLQRLGRWDEARRLAVDGADTHPGDLPLALAAVSCLLHQATPADLTEADTRLAAATRAITGRPAGDPVRQEATRLTVSAHLLGGRFADADRLLDDCRMAGQPVERDAELTIAARPYRWPVATRAAEPVIVPASIR